MMPCEKVFVFPGFIRFKRWTLNYQTNTWPMYTTQTYLTSRFTDSTDGKFKYKRGVNQAIKVFTCNGRSSTITDEALLQLPNV